MKVFLPYIYLFFSISVWGQNPDYFGNSPKWECELEYQDPEFGTITNSYIEFFVEGDTNLIGLNYSIIRKKSVSIGWNDTSTTHLGYYRQEGRSIYQYCSGIDTLVISYDKGVGDSFEGIFTFGFDQFGPIEKIDSILMGSEYRKIFYVDTLNYNVTFIEGVGHIMTNSFLNDCRGFHFRNMIVDNNMLSFYRRYLNSYSESNVEYWNVETTSCFQTANNEDFKEDDFKIYPNPVIDNLNILNYQSFSSYQIFNLNGQLVMQGEPNYSIDITHLEKGMYFLVLNQEDYQVHKKFIKH